MAHNQISIRPYTHQELADLYGMTWGTMKRWLKPLQRQLGAKIGHYYNIRQVRIIFNRLGWPPSGQDTEDRAAA